MQPPEHPMQFRHMALATLVVALWGCNFVAVKLALAELPVFLLLALRFVLVALLLAPLMIRYKVYLKDALLLSVILGLLHFSLMFGSLALGLDASGAVIAAQLAVPFSCLLGGILHKDRLTPVKWFGMAVSFTGILIVAGTPGIYEHGIGFAAACLGAMAAGWSNIFMKRLRPGSTLPLIGWMALFCIPQYFALSLIFESGQMERIAAASPQTWLALSYTVIGSTVMAYGIWLALLKKFPVSRVVPFALLIPVFGLASARWFFAEPMTPLFLLGGALTILGVGIILFHRQPVKIMEGV